MHTKSLYRRLIRIKGALIDHHHYKYISYYKALLSLYRTRNINIKNLTNSELATYKSSETIFILGSGPSLNKLSSEHINLINKHDSFGMSYSILKREIIPTYHYFGWHRGRYDRWKDVFSPFREIYKDVIIIMHTKALYSRLIHPRFTPLLFPIDPLIYVCKIPEPIILTDERMITNEEFNRSLLYRGALSFILNIVVKMGYKKIVLLGIDLDTHEHFWDQNPIMYTDTIKRQENYNKRNLGDQFETQYSRPDKMLAFDKYLFYLNEYLLKEKNITLFSGFENKILSEFLSSYFVFN